MNAKIEICEIPHLTIGEEELCDPQHVTRTDQTIVAWDDVPVAIQKKILNGTMTEEDWDSDWNLLEVDN